MTAITNVYTTTAAVGNFNDIEDEIYNVAPVETPVVAMIKKGKAKNILHQWQTDTLTAASETNYALEGDAEAAAAATATVMESNTTQIFKKVFAVSGTQEAVEHYGRASEIDYQRMKNSKALKRDIEKMILSTNAEVTSDSPRELGGFGAWDDTNTSFGVGGADGTRGNTARTDGTQRQFTEDLLKPVLQLMWTNGSHANRIIVGGYNKQRMSTFGGNASRQVDAKDKQLFAAIKVYSSDFDDLQVIPCRQVRTRDCLILDPDYLEWTVLRKMHIERLAKTGDGTVEAIRVEGTLSVLNEVAHGAVHDLTDADA